MNTPTRMGAFAAGLVAVFGVAAGLGAVVGPLGPADAETDHGGVASHGDTATGSGEHGTATGGGDATTEIPGGLMISQRGYTLTLAQPELPAGAATPVAFRILGPAGQAVTAYDRSHDEDLHLIAVRRDLTGFQHVHPELAPDGTWRTPLSLAPGSWRLFADFDPAGPDEAMTLGADVSVPGDHAPQPLPDPTTAVELDGYTVTLDGELVPGRESAVTLSVSRDGEPVTDLQPYLAAYGHLVVLRAGDMAYLHVHPAGEPGDGRTQAGPDIPFYVSVPSAGDYRLFLDFRHGGAVRTAGFTARAGDLAAAGPGAATAGAPGHTDAGDTDSGRAEHGHGG